jgi:hypothetical protein
MRQPFPAKYRTAAAARPTAVIAAPTTVAAVKETAVVGERSFLQNSDNLFPLKSSFVGF